MTNKTIGSCCGCGSNVPPTAHREVIGVTIGDPEEYEVADTLINTPCKCGCNRLFIMEAKQ